MTTRIDLLYDLIEALIEKGRPEQIAFMAKVIPTSQRVFAVATPEMRKIVKAFYPEIKELEFEKYFDLVLALKATEIFECGQLSNEFIAKNKNFRRTLKICNIQQLMMGLDNWASVDSFATYVTGPTWIDGQICVDNIREWSSSGDVWIRRLAIVSAVILVRKSSEAWKRDITFELCLKHLHEREMIIHKAISWALRTMVPIWSEEVLGFVDSHKRLFKPFVEREVVNKVKTGKKN